MRPFVIALTCVALLFVSTAANAQDFGKTVFETAVSQAEDASLSVQASAEEVPALCAVAAKASVCPEVVNSNYARFMQLGQTFMLGMQILGEARVEASLAETDAEYLDATKKVLLAKRAFDRVGADLGEITAALKDAIKQAETNEA